MPLSVATLKAGFEALEPTAGDPSETIAAAFDDYFKENVAGPIAGNGEAGAKSAMVGALSGIKEENAASGAIAAGITAYWGVATASAAIVWPTAPPAVLATPPPGLGGLQAAIDAAFASNLASSATLPDAAGVLASAIHALQAGAVVIFPPPMGGGIGPQPVT